MWPSNGICMVKRDMPYSSAKSEGYKVSINMVTKVPKCKETATTQQDSYITKAP